jgi:hypothetical protein
MNARLWDTGNRPRQIGSEFDSPCRPALDEGLHLRLTSRFLIDVQRSQVQAKRFTGVQHSVLTLSGRD